MKDGEGTKAEVLLSRQAENGDVAKARFRSSKDKSDENGFTSSIGSNGFSGFGEDSPDWADHHQIHAVHRVGLSNSSGSIGRNSVGVLTRNSGTQDQGLCDMESCVVIPSTDNFMYSSWEVLLGILLVLCAFYVPYDVVIQNEETIASNVVNLVVDMVFTIDILLRFFVAFEQKDINFASHYETSLVRIAKRYCGPPFSERGEGGWFWIDILTVVPAWGLRLMRENYTGPSHHVRLLALIRCLRLLRLVRLGYLVRVLSLRWNRRSGFSLTMTDNVKNIFIGSIICHYLALAWVSIESKEFRGIVYVLIHGDRVSESESWLSDIIGAKEDLRCAKDEGFCVYTLALYWTLMTLTSVGYGDITPQIMEEYVVNCLSLLILGFLWAYLVGGIVAYMSNADPHGKLFTQQMDELTQMCRERGVPWNLQAQLRTYMIKSMPAYLRSMHGELLEDRISKRLTEEVYSQTRGSLLDGVWWTHGLQPNVRLRLVSKMKALFFGPGEELLYSQTLVLIRGGRAKVKPRIKILNAGDFWGEINILLLSEHLVQETVVTVTFVDALMLHQDNLREVCAQYPSADRRLRHAQVRCAVFRGFCHYAREHAAKQSLNSLGFAMMKDQLGSFAGSQNLDTKGLAILSTKRNLDNVKIQLEELTEKQKRFDEQMADARKKIRRVARMRRRRLGGRSSATMSSRTASDDDVGPDRPGKYRSVNGTINEKEANGQAATNGTT